MVTKEYDDGIRKVEVLDDTIIRYTLVNHKRTEYFSYNEGLFDILTRKGVSPDLWDGRGRIKYHGTGCYLYDLACAVYYGFVDSMETLESGLQAYFEHKDINDLQVDHANNNRKINTRENLSLLPAYINRRKSAIVTRFRGFDDLFIAHCDGEYRILLSSMLPSEYLYRILNGARIRGPGMKDGKIKVLFWKSSLYDAGKFYVCKTPEDLLDCLKYLQHSSFPGMPEGETMYTRYKANKHIAHWAQYEESAIDAQRELTLADADFFHVWTSEQ